MVLRVDWLFVSLFESEKERESERESGKESFVLDDFTSRIHPLSCRLFGSLIHILDTCSFVSSISISCPWNLLECEKK